MENPKNYATAIEKLNRKFNNFEKALFQFFSMGKCDQKSFNHVSDLISNSLVKRGTVESWIQFLSDRSQSIILIVTYRPMGIISFLNAVFKMKEEDHVMLISLTDEDKHGN